MPGHLPTDTVTLLFTDIEGSTGLLHELGAEGYAGALAEHRRALREAFGRHGGVEVDTQGDAFFYAFAGARDAVRAAAEAQQALGTGRIRVRMGLHTGSPHVTTEGYVGEDVHKAARIASAAHGGQVVLSSETRALLGDAEVLTDLGEHRLKDFAGAVPIFQLGAERFPPLKTISNTNLPRPVSSFVGREREVGRVVSLLRGGARLLTLTGPGGSGKTRLAIAAASELVPQFKAGVFWVGLATIRDPELVPEEIARTLGARDGPAEHVGEREMLLLLDNLEQVVDAAPELASLLESCPNLQLLVTSRELLRVRGEVEYPVPPLAALEAVDLFCARARMSPDRTVEELCRALDHLPLAIELAAARAGVLSPAKILDRLSGRLDLLKGGRDADPRQRTLRATIDWSHELLTPEEQQLFARLSVFRGGCSLDAAEEVAGADLDTLQSLVEKSLLRRREDRLWMLETVREYALERLEASGEADEVRRRHADHFLALAEEAEPHLAGSTPRAWLDRVEREHDNLRAAFDSLEASGDTLLVLRLAGGIWYFWHLRGHSAEGRRRLHEALRADQRGTLARARALAAAASMMVEGGGDVAGGKLLAEEALRLHRELGDVRGVAHSLWTLGYAVAEGGDWGRARELVEESVRLFGELGDESSTLWATRTLAWTYDELGDLEHARRLHQDNLLRARALSEKRMEAVLLGALAMIAVKQGQFKDAFSQLRANLPLYLELGDRLPTVVNLCRCAHALALAGKPTPATGLLASAKVLFEEIGASVPWVSRMNEETVKELRAQLDDEAFREAWSRGRQLSLDHAVALALESLG